MTHVEMSCKETLKKYIAWLSDYSEPCFNTYCKELLRCLPDDINMLDARILFEDYKVSKCPKTLDTLISFIHIQVFQTLVKRDLGRISVMDYIQCCNERILQQINNAINHGKISFVLLSRNIQNFIESLMVTYGCYKTFNMKYQTKIYNYSKFLTIYDTCMQSLGRHPTWTEFKAQLPVDSIDAYTCAKYLNLPFYPHLYDLSDYEFESQYDMTHITFLSPVTTWN